MKVVRLLLFISLLGLTASAQVYKCLESGVKETDVSSVKTTISRKGEAHIETITVRQALMKIKARCVRDKLVDGGGKPVRCYRLQGCWGNPPADYLEILEHQRKEIESLKKQFTVIEMTCNPAGNPPQSISREHRTVEENFWRRTFA